MKAHLYIAAGMVAATAFACSSNDSSGSSSPAPTNGGAASANQVADSGTDAAQNDDDASSLSQQQLDACYDLANQARNQIYMATGQNSYPDDTYKCTTDDDCIFVDDSTKCASSCGEAIAKSAASTVAMAIAQVNAGLCASSTGCPGFSGTCTKPFGVTCNYNQCTVGIPSAWQNFVIESDAGGTGSTLPATCSGSNCTLWTVTPDAKFTVSNGSSIVRSGSLSASDFATLDTTLRSQNFRNDAIYGVSCYAASSTEHVSDSVLRGTVDVGGDVSGCVGKGPAGNDYLNLYNLVTRY